MALVKPVAVLATPTKFPMRDPVVWLYLGNITATYVTFVPFCCTVTDVGAEDA